MDVIFYIRFPNQQPGTLKVKSQTVCNEKKKFNVLHKFQLQKLKVNFIELPWILWFHITPGEQAYYIINANETEYYKFPWSLYI